MEKEGRSPALLGGDMESGPQHRGVKSGQSCGWELVGPFSCVDIMFSGGVALC